MEVRPLKRYASLVSLVVVLLTPAACDDGGAGGGDRPAGEVLAAAASATQEAGTARIASDQVAEVQGQRLTTTVEGVTDLNSGDSESTIELAVPGQPPQAAQFITAGSVAYIETAAFPGAPTDVEWISIDFAQLGDEIGVNIEAFRQNGAGQLGYLGEVGDVEEVGTETVRDAETTHYRFTTDLEALADGGPEELRSSYRQLIELTGAREIPTEVWIDEDDRVRRISTDLEIEQQGRQLSQRSTIEYYEFGVEVDAQAPPAEDTVSITELGAGRAP
ncbi:MAG: hypothetical protein ACRDK3_00440 [Actinomycetota bacterium]